MDYFIMVFHNDVITPAFSERGRMELQETLHQSSAWAVIDKYLPEWIRLSCPLRAESSGKLPYPPLSCYGAWLSPPPFSCEQQLRFFSRLLVWTATVLVPKLTCRYWPRLLMAVKFLSSHTLLKRSFMTKQILCSGERYVLRHCLCSSPPLPSVRNTADD